MDNSMCLILLFRSILFVRGEVLCDIRHALFNLFLNASNALSH